MTKQKTIPELQAEIAANERQLAQLQHKQQQLENRRSYYEKGDRRKRAHRLITRGAAIYFNFVGRFVPPAFGEVELTPEELEEIRKREERKDRLHQNYLKRKASGAQKRYEDKIKGRKKAEIEAKKAAIRAEDIAKGVFVPVSSLPLLLMFVKQIFEDFENLENKKESNLNKTCCCRPAVNSYNESGQIYLYNSIARA